MLSHNNLNIAIIFNYGILQLPNYLCIKTFNCFFLGMRGSTPLDVAAASCIDNNELALALQEQDLEMVLSRKMFLKLMLTWYIFNNLSLADRATQVVTYLAGCGLQMCPMLLSKGYPDIGWNPSGGERYLDFLRFAVFVNGQHVRIISVSI